MHLWNASYPGSPQGQHHSGIVHGLVHALYQHRMAQDVREIEDDRLYCTRNTLPNRTGTQHDVVLGCYNSVTVRLSWVITIARQCI